MRRHSTVGIRRIAVGAISIVIFGTAPVVAQDNHASHVPVPLPADVDPAKLFQERILHSQERAGFTDIAKLAGSFDAPRQLGKLLSDNPQIRDLLRGYQDGDPESKNRVRQLLAEAQKSGSIPRGLSTQTLEKLLQGIPPEQLAVGRSFQPHPSEPTSDSRFTNRPQSSSEEVAARREIAHQVADLTKRLPEHLPESLRKSPAVKDFVHRLSDSAFNALGGTSADGWDAQLARLEARWHVLRDWLPKQMPASLRNIRFPDLSQVAPDVHLPQLDLSTPEMPSLSRYSGETTRLGSAANVVLVLIGTGLTALLIWRLRGGRNSARVGDHAPLGPWPLDPTHVATRAELIRAFEYLSLLHCGEPARTWHHRAIAERLGGSEVDRQMAADRLAALYERARYAPSITDEPDWSVAREPLSLLAGAS